MTCPRWIWSCCSLGARCCHRCAQIFLASLALLQLLLVFLLYAHNRIMLPDFVLARAHAWLEAHDLQSGWDAISVDLTGGLLVQGLELRHRNGELVAQADAVFADLNLFTLLTGYGHLFEAVSARNFKLFKPAMFSATGMNEPMWQSPELHVERRGQQVLFQRFLWRDGNDKFSVVGTLYLPHLPQIARSDDPETTDVGRMQAVPWEGAWHRLATVGRYRRQVQSGAEPLLLEVNLNTFGTFTAVHVRAFCSELLTRGLFGFQGSARRLFLDGRFLLDAQGWHPAPSQLSIATVRFAGLGMEPVSLNGLVLHLPAEDRLELTVASCNVLDLVPEALQLRVHAQDSQWSSFNVDLAAVLWEEPWSLSTVRLAADSRGPLDLDIRLPIEPLLLHPLLDLPAVAEMVSLSQPLRLAGRIHLEQPLMDSRFSGFFGVEQLTVREAFFETARGRIAVDRHRVLVHQATALNQLGQTAYGGYVQYFDPLDFRIFARGTLNPKVLDSLLEDWWHNIWRNMSMQGPPAFGDVDVFGRWGTDGLLQARVYARGEQALYREQSVRSVELELFHQRGFVEIPRLHAEADGGGSFSGSLLWVFPREPEEPLHSFFDISSDLALPVLLAALGQDAQALDWVQPGDRPNIQLSGHRRESRGDSPDSDERLPQQVSITASAGQGEVQGVPFDNMELQLTMSGSALSSESIRLRLFGGEVAGSLQVSDYQDVSATLQLRLAGEGLDYGAVAVWLGGNENTGSLAFTTELTGLRGQPETMTGFGSVSVAGADFGRIRMLGPLTRLLDGIGLNFSSFALNTATAGFQLLPGQLVQVPDLRIEGPSANIQAQGEVFLATKNLDFDVRVFLLDTPGFTLRSIVGLVLRPLSHVLELRVSGAVDEPNWRFRNNPFNFLLPNVDPVTSVSSGPSSEE